ncbi:hypothetical protein D1631_18295 [Chryseobacterium nematophagum]|uniref:Uncharacterized protein n=1 Tax=Chryseobacterium nematophagum TaxID=2305228 RepID=A0A3M7TBG9_9FLAO|nr:hypothetical protein D1631_18295 [Chryseobacterium nematophagum]
MKHKFLVILISVLIILGFLLIGISVDILLNKNYSFLIIGLGTGLLAIAVYLEILRRDEENRD